MDSVLTDPRDSDYFQAMLHRIMAVVAMLVAFFGVAGAHPAAAARGPRICPLDQVGTIFAQLDAACPCGEAVSKREYRPPPDQFR
ncbi:MAG: hypothetical protein ACKOYO_10105 [Actinomycetota bacterium]